jgi:ABC-type Fe3+/spermidine/putrescine transport system ATPase subunit
LTGDAVHRTTAPNDAILRFASVWKSYGVGRAVDDISFELTEGEVLTLLGPSGCGKTTTLRIAVGLEHAGGGEVWLNGRLVDAPGHGVFVPTHHRDIGMVFQSYAVWPHMTVFQNVAYPLKVRRRSASEIREAVTKALNLVGLESFRDRPGTKLSGGQQQRVAVARGLVFGPDLLLLDEPFSNLDAKLREQMRTEIKLLQRRLGISVLFVTHDQSEALALSDRIAVMRGGRMEQIGAPRELYAAPRTAAVRDFLGRVILLPGRITGRGADGVRVRVAESADIVAAGADHTGGSTEGACLVAVRPEHVAVDLAPVSLGANCIRGRIAALLFLGDRFEGTIELPSGRLISIHLAPSRSWQEDQQVALTLPPARTQVWPTETQAGNA